MSLRIDGSIEMIDDTYFNGRLSLLVQMHHIAVQIINDTDSEDSADEFADYLYRDVGDLQVFHQMWHGQTPPSPEDLDPNGPLESVKRAYSHMKEAMSDITSVRSAIQSAMNQNGFAFAKVREETIPPKASLGAQIVGRKHQLKACSESLLSSASVLRDEIDCSKQYFRALSELSKKFPLKLIKDKDDNPQISVSTRQSASSTSIIIVPEKDHLRWKLTDESRFSFNSKSFCLDEPSNYLQCFFELMCHELFERIKTDRIKSAIHYSADKDTRSIYFDVGNKETWVFELGAPKEVGKVPVWIPRLIDSIMDPHAQPATFMRQLLFFKATLDSMLLAFSNRFMKSDFCTVIKRTDMCKTALQIDSPYLAIPYLAFIDKWRVSMTETPNELRCIPYSTDGRGLTPALEKWCDSSYSTLFLAMAERITRSFGFVFKNKNQYGTAAMIKKKIKFTPQQKNSDVEIQYTSKNGKPFMWSQVPGTDHIVRMCCILFNDKLFDDKDKDQAE